MRRVPLSPTTKNLLNAFDKAAQGWGYEMNEGWGDGKRHSREDYQKAKFCLLTRLMEQEAEIRRLRALVKDCRRVMLRGTK